MLSSLQYARCFVRSFGWYEDENDLYIAMEYLIHGDLHHYLRDEPALPELDAQQIAVQICEGLLMMHENGFAHRDLKPGVCSDPTTQSHANNSRYFRMS